MNVKIERTDTPLVSVIIIFLNAEKFIEEAIESVFAQTYKNWELLLVDDGSTDLSTDIAFRYAGQHPEKVRYLEHENHQNKGMSATRNLGIKSAKGKYIAFLDADDAWLPLKLERQVQILETNPEVSMVYGPVQFWYSWTENPKDRERDFITDTGVQPDTIIFPPDLVLRCLENKPPVPLPTVIMVRRDTAIQLNGFEEAFKGKYQLHEDLGFSIKVFLNESVFITGDCLTRYRRHADNCGTFWAQRGEYHHQKPHEAQFFFLNWFKEYLIKHNVNDPLIFNVLKKVLWPYRYPLFHRIQTEMLRFMGDLRWAYNVLLMNIFNKINKLINFPSGHIVAEPNPLTACDWSGIGVVKLEWSAKKVEEVEIRINSPDGGLFTRSDPSGSATTGNWVCDKMSFYLQNITGGKPPSLRNTLDITRVRVIPATMLIEKESGMLGKWKYQNLDENIRYGDDTTYQKGMTFLDGHGAIEDWGCGLAYAKKFVKKSKYFGIDGTHSGFEDKIVDLRYYISNVNCIFMRHILEHNHDWRMILDNAIRSFKKRMVLIIFTPFSDKTRRIASADYVTKSPVPDISFRKDDLIEFFKHFKFNEEALETNTQYKKEHIFYIEKY